MKRYSALAPVTATALLAATTLTTAPVATAAPRLAEEYGAAAGVLPTAPGPTNGPAYYVATDGSNTKAGTSVDAPFQTITHALSVAPENATIYIKAGDYGAEILEIPHNNIRILGYATTPGDQPRILANAAGVPRLNPKEMPVLTGTDRTKGTAIDLGDRTGVVIANIGIRNYEHGVRGGREDDREFRGDATLFNVNVQGVGDLDDEYDGIGIGWGSMGTSWSNGNKILASTVVDAAAEGIIVTGNDNIVDHSAVYSTDPGDYGATDYYVMLTGSDNRVSYTTINRAPGSAHGGHGFSVKSEAEYSDKVHPVTGNTFTNNLAENVGEAYVVRHRGAADNTFATNKAVSDGCETDGGGIQMRDGAHDNTFSDMVLENVCQAIYFTDTVENGGDTPYPNDNNVVERMTVRGARYAIYGNPGGIRSDIGASTVRDSRFEGLDNVLGAFQPMRRMAYPNNTFIGVKGAEFARGSFAGDRNAGQFTGSSFANIDGAPR